jgi:hypothetical protein
MEQNAHQEQFPPQHQTNQPGKEHEMHPQPDCTPFYKGIDKFKNQTVLITGGDSGIGRAVALAFANEVAGAFTWLASKEASYVTGQVIHPNGGYIVNT